MDAYACRKIFGNPQYIEPRQPRNGWERLAIITMLLAVTAVLASGCRHHHEDLTEVCAPVVAEITRNLDQQVNSVMGKVCVQSVKEACAGNIECLLRGNTHCRGWEKK